MEKTLICRTKFLNEQEQEHVLSYWLLVCSSAEGEVYGVGIEESDEAGVLDRVLMCGLSIEQEEVRSFIDRLCAGTGLPTELAGLCDDFVSEQELKIA